MLPADSDGTSTALVPLTIGLVLLFAITTYLGLDQAFGVSDLFVLTSGSAEVGQLRNVGYWMLTVLWPYA